MQVTASQDQTVSKFRLNDVVTVILVNDVVTVNKYALRDSPEIRNEPIDEIPGGKKQIGNILAEFPRGSRGEAIAEGRDKSGQPWWFVLMDIDSKTITNLFYADEGAYKAGWMRQQDLDIDK